MKKQIATLLEKPMGRKEFLQHAGMGVLMLFGGGLVAQAVGSSTRKSSATAGYGGDSYGGAKRA